MKRQIMRIIGAYLLLGAMLFSLCACGAKKEEGPTMIRHDKSEDLVLLVDFQNVYLPGQEWACPTVEKAMENTLALVADPNAPDYVMTKYMAPENPVGCWVRYNEEYAAINADAWLCAFCDAVQPLATEGKVVVKDTYSSLDAPELDSLLAGKKRIVLTGVVAECCVLATMMDAIDRGFEVVYLTDCIAGNTAEHEKMIADLAATFSPMHTQVMTSGEYLRSVSPEG